MTLVAGSRAVRVAEAGGDFEWFERPVPSPGRGQVRVRVQACGICRSDSWAKAGGHPRAIWPVVPGHEVAGVIDEVGEGVEGWTAGDGVGVGWYGGHCGWCEACRAGDLVMCRRMPITGISIDGGYADHVVADARALARVPAGMAPDTAAPLMCAGVTVFNALRHSRARGGDRVAVLGVGGLGHLAVQFASRMGFETVAIGRGATKEGLARECGAHHYVDSTAADPGAVLAGLGGADVLLATAPSADAVQACMGGIGRRGQVVVVGVAVKPLRASPATLIDGGISLVGHTSGTAQDSEDALRFAARFGVTPVVESVPLESAAEAYERMLSGQARARMVLRVET